MSSGERRPLQTLKQFCQMHIKVCYCVEGIVRMLVFRFYRVMRLCILHLHDITDVSKQECRFIARVIVNTSNALQHANHYTTVNTRDEFRNMSVTEADAARKADLNWKL